MVEAAFEIEDVDFQGLAPAQSWSGEPNDYIVRESYIFKPSADMWDAGSIAEGGNTGAELVEGPFSAEQTENFDYQGACFQPQG